MKLIKYAFIIAIMVQCENVIAIETIRNAGIIFGANYNSKVSSSRFQHLVNRYDEDIRNFSKFYGLDFKLNISQYLLVSYLINVETDRFTNMQEYVPINDIQISCTTKFLNQNVSLLLKINKNKLKHTFFNIGAIHAFILNQNYRFDSYYNISDSTYIFHSSRFRLAKWTIALGLSRETTIKNSSLYFFRSINYTFPPIQFYKTHIIDFVSNKFGLLFGIGYRFHTNTSNKS